MNKKREANPENLAVKSISEQPLVSPSLKTGLAELGLTVSHLQQQQLEAYLALLQKWNRRINLISAGDMTKALSRHVLDSLAVAPYVQGERIIDVGTGAGFPGIPLSIIFPEKKFFLLDSNQKKQIFLSQVVKSLPLQNVECVCMRVQAYQPVQKFSTILTRAFSPLAQLLPLTTHLLAEEGQLLAMLGKAPESHTPLPGYHVAPLISLSVPGEKGERHLAIIRKKQE